MSSFYCIEDDSCYRNIPLLHRMLVDPTPGPNFPNVTNTLPLRKACAITETLDYAQRSLLGWAAPGAGLAWWYASGKPVDDGFLGREWWEACKCRQQIDGANPYCGGSNSQHLGRSDFMRPDETSFDRARLHFDAATLTTVLIVNHLSSWGSDLERAAMRLPETAGRFRLVEVFDRPAGHLGQFRRSRDAERWFEGEHGIHMRGQRLPKEEYAS